MKTWKDVPGWFDYQEIFDLAVYDAPQDRARFVEIGALFGRSTCYMASLIGASKKKIDFSVIDTWNPAFFAPGPLLTDDRKNMGRFADAHGGFEQTFRWALQQCKVSHLVDVIKCDQVEASLRFNDNTVDFIFLDTDHSEASTRAAIIAWLPKLKSGGVFAGHDYNKRWPGVIAAVNDLLPGFTLHGNSFWWRA